MNFKLLSLISAVLFVVIFCACGKGKNKNKEWVFYIDSIPYKTNSYTGTLIEGNTRVSATNLINNNHITLTLEILKMEFPKTGIYALTLGQSAAGYAALGVSINDSIYLKGRHYEANVIASEEEGKAKYTIEPIWLFTQYESNGVLLESTDSILFWGTLYEPESITIRE